MIDKIKIYAPIVYLNLIDKDFSCPITDTLNLQYGHTDVSGSWAFLEGELSGLNAKTEPSGYDSISMQIREVMIGIRTFNHNSASCSYVKRGLSTISGFENESWWGFDELNRSHQDDLKRHVELVLNLKDQGIKLAFKKLSDARNASEMNDIPIDLVTSLEALWGGEKKKEKSDVFALMCMKLLSDDSVFDKIVRLIYIRNKIVHGYKPAQLEKLGIPVGMPMPAHRESIQQWCQLIETVLKKAAEEPTKIRDQLFIDGISKLAITKKKDNVSSILIKKWDDEMKIC